MADSEAKSGGSKKYTPISYSVEPPISENFKNLERKIEISTKTTKTAEKELFNELPYEVLATLV